MQVHGIAMMSQSCKVGTRNLMIHGLRVVYKGKPERPEKSRSSIPKKTSKVSNPRAELKAANHRQETGSYSSLFIVIMVCDKQSQALQLQQ